VSEKVAEMIDFAVGSILLTVLIIIVCGSIAIDYARATRPASACKCQVKP
jgi:uncharacterized membrane protein YdcZ (DUF606 family)